MKIYAHEDLMHNIFILKFSDFDTHILKYVCINMSVHMLCKNHSYVKGQSETAQKIKTTSLIL